MESLEAELDRARGLDVGNLADAIESIGFECTRCGACCTAVDGSGCENTSGDLEGESDAGESAGDGHHGEAGGDGDSWEAGGEGDGGDFEGESDSRELDSERDGGDFVDERDSKGVDSEGDNVVAEGPTAGHDHIATVFPEEVRRLQRAASDDGETCDWRDVARPMPYGLDAGSDGAAGETFEWSLQVDECGNCTFYEEDGVGRCTVHDDRPLVCRTYPFSVALGGTSQPMGEAVDAEGMVRAHECEGLGRDISRRDAERMAATLKRRAVRELEEAIAVRDEYRPVDTDGVVVHDSEGAKHPDGTPLE